MSIKICSKCKLSKELTDFYLLKSSKDGYTYSCKYCRKQADILRKDKIREYNKNYRILNSIKIKQYYNDNIKKILKYKKEWAKKVDRREYYNNYIKLRSATDPTYKLSRSLRSIVNKALKCKNWNKDSSNEKILGNSFCATKEYIESKFTKGMTWNNYGKWHIDHIIPLSSANNKEELYTLFNYKNLQPLWATDNLKKSDSMVVIF